MLKKDQNPKNKYSLNLTVAEKRSKEVARCAGPANAKKYLTSPGESPSISGDSSKLCSGTFKRLLT
jgi:hypothetical protein